jgi:hypothetical protein
MRLTRSRRRQIQRRPPSWPPAKRRQLLRSAPGLLLEPRDYKVTAIPGVVATGAHWNFVCEQLTHSGDGIPGAQVLCPDGEYLGLIRAPGPVISAAFSGRDKKTLYILARSGKDQAGNEIPNAAQVYTIEMIASGFKKRAK